MIDRRFAKLKQPLRYNRVKFIEKVEELKPESELQNAVMNGFIFKADNLKSIRSDMRRGILLINNNNLMQIKILSKKPTYDEYNNFTKSTYVLYKNEIDQWCLDYYKNSELLESTIDISKINTYIYDKISDEDSSVNLIDILDQLPKKSDYNTSELRNVRIAISEQYDDKYGNIDSEDLLKRELKDDAEGVEKSYRQILIKLQAEILQNIYSQQGLKQDLMITVGNPQIHRNNIYIESGEIYLKSKASKFPVSYSDPITSKKTDAFSIDDELTCVFKYDKVKKCFALEYFETTNENFLIPRPIQIPQIASSTYQLPDSKAKSLPENSQRNDEDKKKNKQKTAVAKSEISIWNRITDGIINFASYFDDKNIDSYSTNESAGMPSRSSKDYNSSTKELDQFPQTKKNHKLPEQPPKQQAMPQPEQGHQPAQKKR